MTLPAATAAFVPTPITRAHWLWPGAMLALGTVLVWTLDLDRRITALYFDKGGPPDWPVGYLQPWDFLYTWGVVPAMGVAVAGIALLVTGITRRLPWQRWAGTLILFSLLIGPFLLTNGVFHELWGRPRPRQVAEFGGDRPFRPVLHPTFRRGEPGFPAGHAAGGFSVLILYFALRPRSRRLAWGALGLGLGLGGITAWARVTQGGHFLSDGLWSAGVIWFSACGVQWGMARWGVPAMPTGPLSRIARVGTWMLGLVATGGLLLGYLAFMPIQEQSNWAVDIPPGTLNVEVFVATQGHIRLKDAPGTSQVRVFATLSGRGWPWASLWERRAGPVAVGKDVRLHYTAYGQAMRRRGNVTVAIVAPPGLKVTVQQVDVQQVRRAAPPAKAGAPGAN